MTSSKTQFQIFLDNEVNKVKGIYYPVKAGFLRRILIRRAPCSRMHPNPYDEFSQPNIGPNPRIITEYVNLYKEYRFVNGMTFLTGNVSQPVIVEKAYPAGYIILNGHHRWAAATRVGLKNLPIRIVDLTQKEDLRKMLNKARSDKRVTLDLDETVFRSDSDPCIEKSLPFPLNRIYTERLRLGIPALFRFLVGHGYEIWVFSARYYSLEYIRKLFRHYHIPVTGIVTGTSRKGPEGKDTIAELEQMLSRQYCSTLHIDGSAVLHTRSDSKEYEEYALSGPDASWSAAVMTIIEDRIYDA